MEGVDATLVLLAEAVDDQAVRVVEDLLDRPGVGEETDVLLTPLATC